MLDIHLSSPGRLFGKAVFLHFLNCVTEEDERIHIALFNKKNKVTGGGGEKGRVPVK